MDVVKFLVEAGANIHAKNGCALNSSIIWGHLDIVKYLVESGAYVHAYNDPAY